LPYSIFASIAATHIIPSWCPLSGGLHFRRQCFLSTRLAVAAHRSFGYPTQVFSIRGLLGPVSCFSASVNFLTTPSNQGISYLFITCSSPSLMVPLSRFTVSFVLPVAVTISLDGFATSIPPVRLAGIPETRRGSRRSYYRNHMLNPFNISEGEETSSGRCSHLE